MANSTWSGPVRSENGFEVVTKNTTTGTFTTSLDIASDGSIDLTYSSTSTGGTNIEPVVVENTMTGAGGLAGRSRFQLNADAALGSYSNALKAITVYGANGSTSGLGSAAVMEMTMSAGTSSGTYAPVEVELNMPANASTGTATSLFYTSVNGDDASTFDDNGFVMNIAGLTAGSSKAFASNGSIGNVDEITHGLKVKIGSETYYLLLANAANFAD